jgi:uncharacterized membrane protein
MDKTGKKQSMVHLVVELFEDIIVLVFIELKRALLEIKHNVGSVEKGAIMMVLGAGLLFFSLLVFIGTTVAVLALYLPAWLAALLVALALTFFGVAFLFTGLGKFKDFTLVPSETLKRVEDISRSYKKVGAGHQLYEEPIIPEQISGSPVRGHSAH